MNEVTTLRLLRTYSLHPIAHIDTHLTKQSPIAGAVLATRRIQTVRVEVEEFIMAFVVWQSLTNQT